MTPNLQQWMDQYAQRFAGAAQPAQNLGAGAPPDAAPPASPAQEIPGDGFGEEGGEHSFESMFRAMPEKEQDHHVAELEKQVGDINRAYDSLQKQLGQRPNTKLTRREKGMLVMEFGLQLMSQSSAGRHGGDIGGAVGDAGIAAMGSYRNLAAGKKAEAKQWDQDNAGLALGRIKDVGAARKEGLAMARQDRQDDLTQTRADETARHNAAMEGASETRIRNLENWRDTSDANTDANRTARGKTSAGGGATANQRNIDDLVKRGVPEDLAVRLVYKRIEDPRKAWQSLYDNLRRSFTNEEDAKAEADRVMRQLYGDDALENLKKTIVPEGKKVVRTGKLNGRKVVQYSDGTTEFAD